MSAECDAECGEFIRRHFRDRGIEATVSSARPLVRTPYEPLGLRCPHGRSWHAEPTSGQIAQWAAAGVA